MSRGRPDGVVARDPDAAWPATGPAVPVVAVRVLLAVVGIAGCATCLPSVAWAVVGALVAVTAALRPSSLAPWVLAGVLVLHQLGTDPGPGWRFAVLLAAVHLLHVLGGLALALPVRGTLEVRALAAPARRFVVVQAPAQVVAQAALWGFEGSRRPDVPLVAVLAAAALAGLGVLLVRSYRDRGSSSTRPRGERT